MHIGTSYRDIWKISAPIIVGSAAQNVIALTDSVFLYYVSEEDFASIGFVATFYLIVAAIGFGFSRGGQILIARRAGQDQHAAVGRTFYSMMYFELALAGLLFLFMTFGCYWLFAALIDSDVIFTKSLEYISTRRWGVFASYLGVGFIALYTGLARPVFVVVATVVLALVNIVLNKIFIFGGYGFPPMGIAGAGLASTIAEYVTLALFATYMVLDRKNRIYQVFKFPEVDRQIIRQIIRLSFPIVAMAMVGLGSSLVFFGLVENFGERALAVTNLVRIIYLVLCIPAWGFSSGINTIVSFFIGRRKRMAVVPILWKTTGLCTGVTALFTLPFVLFPRQVLYPLLGDERAYLIAEAQPILYVLAVILLVFSAGSIFFNGLIGSGATPYALKIQFSCTLAYMLLIYAAVTLPGSNLAIAWAMEAVYWTFVFGLSYRFLRSGRWKGVVM